MGIFSTLINAAKLHSLCNLLGDDCMPLYRDFSSFAGVYKCDVYDVRPKSGNMHETLCSGISRCKYKAAIIAICEFFERKAIESSGLKYSNGCAAHPVFLSPKKSYKIATKRAQYEAIERHCFYTWFENDPIKHNRLSRNSEFLASIGSLVSQKDDFGQISIATDYDGFLIVSFIALSNGVLFGTAFDKTIRSAQFRSESELLRNCLSFLNSQKTGKTSKNDKVLSDIALKGSKFKSRLYKKGFANISKSKFREVVELEHSLREKIVVVHSTLKDIKYKKIALVDTLK